MMKPSRDSTENDMAEGHIRMAKEMKEEAVAYAGRGDALVPGSRLASGLTLGVERMGEAVNALSYAMEFARMAGNATVEAEAALLQKQYVALLQGMKKKD